MSEFTVKVRLKDLADVACYIADLKAELKQYREKYGEIKENQLEGKYRGKNRRSLRDRQRPERG